MSFVICLTALHILLAAMPSEAESKGSGRDPGFDAAQAWKMRFAGRLKTALQDALADGGPVHAVDVCGRAAERIGREIEQESGYRVSRTALRVRNPGNAPDPWERQVLEQFDQKIDEGTNPGELRAHEELVSGDRVTHRLMTPIVTGPLCLTCHGSALSPEIATALDERYPEDQARGFKPGDLRGAFVIQWQLESEFQQEN